MPSGDRGLPYIADLCRQAVRTHLRAMAIESLSEKEIEVRSDWRSGDFPYRGLSVLKVSEIPADGVLGMQDVGYQVPLVAAAKQVGSAKDSPDLVGLWIYVARKRFQNQRIPVRDDEIPGGVIKQVCKVLPYTPRVPKGLGDWDVRGLLIRFWTRESPDEGE